MTEPVVYEVNTLVWRRSAAGRAPVFPAARRPDETPDPALAAYYRRLLEAVHDHGVRAGDWRLLHHLFALTAGEASEGRTEHSP
ncbi:hypothetical protein [Actinomadura sp. NTSP31]|uniref:hypothetical protein n=1 Tax=Actinomadura sp. NTSP31 TaxID=1735447 RepID=UPI0035C02BC6